MKKEAIVLLVEDNRMDIELTLDAFEQAHFGNRIQVVQTGQEAWILATASESLDCSKSSIQIPKERELG